MKGSGKRVMKTDPLAWVDEPEARIPIAEPDVFGTPLLSAAGEITPAPSGESTTPGPEAVDAVAEPEHVSLTGPLTIAEVAGLQERLKQVAAQGRMVEIDAAAVEKVDTAGLQVLAMLARTLAARGQRLSWVAPGQRIIESARLLGIATLMGLDGWSANED